MSRVAPAPARKYAPPLAARPGAKGGKKLGGFDLVILSATRENIVTIDPQAKSVAVHPKTWSWAKNDATVLGQFVHEKAEAVRLMKVTMYDVSRYAPAVDPNRKVPPPPMGITLLCRDLATLVGDMTKLDPANAAEVKAMAARYGRMRDTMAVLRAAFTEAEGSFEIAQDLLVQKMGLDDG